MTEDPRLTTFPGYDVLAKWDSVSWNDATRETVGKRLRVPREPRFFDRKEWTVLEAVCDRIVPQPPEREKVPLAAYVDQKMFEGQLDGMRYEPLPEQGEAWKQGLAGLDEAARRDRGTGFAALDDSERDDLLRAMAAGTLEAKAFNGMPPASFFEHRVIHDITSAYYAHPTAWSEIGFGGPASPRGYVRTALDRRDPWEASEAKPGREEKARRENKRV